MVDSTLLAIVAVVFVAILILILRNNAKEEPQKLSRKERQKQKQQQKQQQDKQPPKENKKQPKKAPRKDKSSSPTEWEVVDVAQDAKEMLEFLKGKDPQELAKANVSAAKQAAKKRPKKAKEEVSSSDDSASEGASLEGFEQVKKKTVNDKKKKKKEKKPEEAKAKEAAVVAKPYFRPLNPDGTPIKEETPKRGERRPRREGDAEGQGERRPRVEGEKRERKPRPEGEQRDDSDKERKPREPRPPREPREPREPKEARRPITSPPNVKYEEANMDDILNSITQDYQQKPKPSRHSTVFSKIPREIVLKICAKLQARDLARLSSVNHFFGGVCRKDSLWRDLLYRDFALKDVGKAKFFKPAYKVEHMKKYKKAKNDAAVPQGEEKDNKPKNNNKKAADKEEVTQE